MATGRTPRQPLVILFIALAALPVTLLAYFSIAFSTSTVTAEGKDSSQQLAQVTALYVQTSFQSRIDNVSWFVPSSLKSAVGDGQPGTFDLPAIDSTLLDIPFSTPEVRQEIVTDQGGAAQATWPVDPVLRAGYTLPEAWRKAVESARRPYVSDVFQAPLVGRPWVVAVAIPIEGVDGRVDGVLVVHMDAAAISNIVSQFERAHRSRALIVDRQEHVVAGSDLRPGDSLPTMLRGDAAAALAGRSGVAQHSGQHVFSAYQPLLPLGWALIVNDDASVTFANAAQLRWVVLGVALVAAMILLGGLLIGLGLVQRAQEAAALAQRVGWLNRLNEAARAVHGESRGRVMDVIAETARELVGAGCAFLAVYTPGDGEVEQVGWAGPGLLPEGLPSVVRQVRLEAGGKSVVRIDCVEAGLDLPTLRSLLVLPLVDREITIGRLALLRAESFDEEEVAILSQLAQHAVTVIHKVRRDATLADLLDELSGKNHLLEEASRLKSEFLAKMSHELRTPLNSICGFTELLLSADQRGTDTARQVRYLHNVQASAQHLLRLINDILDLSKIEAGRMDLEIEAIDVRAVVNAVVTSVRPLAEPKRLALEARVARGARALGDSTRVSQILTNLLSNAVKFTDDGGRVVLRARRQEAMIEVSVEDTGVGIEPEALAYIFEDFRQADNSTSRQFGGTGLGLSISKRLVELQGGSMGVESSPGRGSRFWFALPAAGPALVHVGETHPTKSSISRGPLARRASPSPRSEAACQT